MAAGNFPQHVTQLIGRSRELADVSRLLREPACRLLTLLGPGGTGKTRLAVEAARQTFPESAVFVDLQPTESPDRIPYTIASALGAPLVDGEDALRQVGRYLQGRDLLLVLDNFDHLIAGSDLLGSLLADAPSVKVLTTSREALNLIEEWLYPLDGLAYPQDAREPGAADCDAVLLFAACAQRYRPDFDLAAELEGVVEVCRLVEGLPLGIELAAGWTKAMDCRALAQEIRRNIDFLETRLRNVPTKHRSMRAVFDQTWRQLTEVEQRVLMGLSVFRGGFTPAAAEGVTGSTRGVLSVLVEKSLVRREEAGRHTMHELLRQFAAEQLQAVPERGEALRDAHADYFAEFLSRRHTALLGQAQLQAIAEVRDDLDNILAAWHWAIERGKTDLLARMAMSLADLGEFQGRYLETAEVLERALPVVEHRNDKATLAVLMAKAGLDIRLGRFDEAQRAGEKCLRLYDELEIPALPGLGTDPRLGAGMLATIRGDYAEAERLGRDALWRAREQGHRPNEEIALYVLTRAAFLEGRYEEAQRFATEAHAVTQSTGDRWFGSICLAELGHIALARGEFDAARRYYRAVREEREAFRDAPGVAEAIVYTGKVALQQRELAEALEHFREGLRVFEDVRDRGGMVNALYGIACASYTGGDKDAAAQHLSRAIAIAAEIRFVTQVLALLVGAAELLHLAGRSQRSLELLGLALYHPGSEQGTKDDAEDTLSRLGLRKSPEMFTYAAQRSAEAEVCALAMTVAAELASLQFATAPAQHAGPTIAPAGQNDASPTLVTRGAPESLMPTARETAALHAPEASGPPASETLGFAASLQLPEPLTPRETEILGLIADGLSNQEIADRLIISVGTAKWYSSQIYGKLGAKSRTQAIARAKALGLLA